MTKIEKYATALITCAVIMMLYLASTHQARAQASVMKVNCLPYKSWQQVLPKAPHEEQLVRFGLTGDGQNKTEFWYSPTRGSFTVLSVFHQKGIKWGCMLAAGAEWHDAPLPKAGDPA